VMRLPFLAGLALEATAAAALVAPLGGCAY
jgi:hypothetical protein